MSTRFGNAIEAFEMYPNDIYGADGVPMWLRLVTVLPKEFLAQIQDARNQIDFLINAGMFGAMFSAVALVAGLRRTHWVELASGRDASDMIAKLAWPQICAAIAAAFLSWGFYRWAVTRVPAWGELVMAAFDCYLPALAIRLGYELPRESEKQREFWVTYGQMVVYRRDPEGDLPFNAALWTRAGVPPAAASNQRESEKEEEDRGDKEDKDP